LDHNHNLLKPDDCSGIESDIYHKAIPKTNPNLIDQGLFQNPKEKRGNEHGDKIE
jgi:hypothetical protein